MTTKTHILLWLPVSLLTLLSVSAVRADNTITLAAIPGQATVGGSVQLQLQFQADALTLGGGIRLHYNADLVRFDRFQFDPALGTDPQLRLQPIGGSDDEVLLVAFGDFDGVSGSQTIGTFEFTALTEGTAQFSTEADVLPAGPFVDDSGNAMRFSYGMASVSIVSAAVPFLGPTALLLVFAALIATATRIVPKLGRPPKRPSCSNS